MKNFSLFYWKIQKSAKSIKRNLEKTLVKLIEFPKLRLIFLYTLHYKSRQPSRAEHSMESMKHEIKEPKSTQWQKLITISPQTTNFKITIGKFNEKKTWQQQLEQNFSKSKNMVFSYQQAASKLTINSTLSLLATCHKAPFCPLFLHSSPERRSTLLTQLNPIQKPLKFTSASINLHFKFEQKNNNKYNTKNTQWTIIYKIMYLNNFQFV